jgi:gamma-D-glutamyl-L-lysine dipeptidyl-peptidase
MKNIYKKIGCLFLFICAGTIAMAQTLNYKNLSLELQSLQKQLVPDKRTAILDIELKDTSPPAFVIWGETNLPDAKRQITQFLTDKKISFVDSVRLLPDSSLGDKTWALASLSVSNLRSSPENASELVSQALMGTPMKVLDFKNNWYRVQTPDHYIGWIEDSQLQRFNPKEMEHWKKSERCIFNSLSGCVYDAPTLKGNIVSDLVLDDLFEVEAVVHRFLRIRTPDGRVGYVRKAGCLSFDAWSKSEPNVQSILSVAKQMMGSPYLWGGISSKATDCSGLVKLAYYSQGIILARDASQQAIYGESIDFNNMNNLQPGDLLFFGRSAQRITHVGIYQGKGDFIHASGMVYISSINPFDPKYNPVRKNVAARRILNSLNTEGIVRVKNHPWYSVQP